MLCHLFHQPRIQREDIHFEIVAVYEESSHYDRKLLRCQDCGALFLFEFYERVDWNEGNDEMYCTYVQVEDAAAAEAMNRERNIRCYRPVIFWEPDGRIYALTD